MSELVWEDPPSRARPRVAEAMAIVVGQLQTHPGRWAKVFDGGGSGRNRRNELLRAAGCETVSSEGGLYARWPLKPESPLWPPEEP